MSEGPNDGTVAHVTKLTAKKPWAGITLALILFIGAPAAFVYFSKRPHVNSTTGANSPIIPGNGNAVGTGNAAIGTNSNSGNQQIAPGATNPQQFNIKVEKISIGGRILSTNYSMDELNEAFPWGWMIITVSGPRIVVYPDPRDGVTWEFGAGSINVTPDFSSHFADFDIGDFSFHSSREGGYNLRNNRMQGKYGMRIGTVFPGPITQSGKPSVHFATLSDNEREPVFVVGVCRAITDEQRKNGHFKRIRKGSAV